MTELRYPNESEAYRNARDALIEAEQALIRQVKAVAEQRLLLYSFMFGPSWDKPCPSCTSIVDGFNSMAKQVGHDAAFVVIGKAEATRIHAWAQQRGWTTIDLISGAASSYQADYRCQTDDDRQYPTLHVFKREAEGIFHFWGTELTSNDLDMIWPYWNLMDVTPAGRPDRPHPPQDFRSEFLEAHYEA